MLMAMEYVFFFYYILMVLWVFTLKCCINLVLFLLIAKNLLHIFLTTSKVQQVFGATSKSFLVITNMVSIKKFIRFS